MELDYKSLRELVKKSLEEECGGGMVHPSAVSPISIIPNKKPDQEGKMAKTQVFGIINDASQIEAMLADEQELDGWIQSKITKAADYIASVKKFLEYEVARGSEAPLPTVSLPPMPSLQEQQGPLSSGDWKALTGLLGRAVNNAQGSGERNAYNEALEFAQNVEKYLQETTLDELNASTNVDDSGTLAKNVKDQAKNKGAKSSVKAAAKYMFTHPKLGGALDIIKKDPKKKANLLSLVAVQLGLDPTGDDLVDIAKWARRQASGSGDNS